jgi:hypothetical protein
MMATFSVRIVGLSRAFVLVGVIAVFMVLAIPSNAESGAEETKALLEEISVKLLEHLPLDKKFALKSLSPEETGLPEDFLRKLTSDLEAALLIASNFEINLTNRLSMEDVWQEAIEFNNANFDELYKSANADVMLMISSRATGAGVEISVTAYSLVGDSAGKVLASSGSNLLAMDLQQNLGVDVNDLNKQMAQVLAEIEKVGATGGLISSPNTYAEYYHNARLLQQRGEVDLAINNYELALAEGYLFVDPLYDLLDLANAKYGENGSKMYFEKRLGPSISSELFELGRIIMGEDPMNWVQPILDRNRTFTPFLAEWMTKTYLDWNRFSTLTVGKARTVAAGLITKEYKSGQFQKYFLDKIRGATVGEASTMVYDSMVASGQRTVDNMTIAVTYTYFTRYHPSDDHRPYMRGFTIHDPVDLTKPIIFCGKVITAEEETCRVIPPDVNVFTNNDTKWFGFNQQRELMEWTVGMHCATRVEYTDTNGFRVVSPVLLSHEYRAEEMPLDIDKISEVVLLCWTVRQRS